MASSTDASAPAQGKLQAVAKYQRFVILALLANIAIIVLSLLISFRVIALPTVGINLFRVTALVVTVFMIFSVVMLARQFTNIVVAIICGLAMFLPLISLLVLVIFNQRATAYLRANGVKVGFLGVDPSKV